MIFRNIPLFSIIRINIFAKKMNNNNSIGVIFNVFILYTVM